MPPMQNNNDVGFGSVLALDAAGSLVALGSPGTGSVTLYNLNGNIYSSLIG